MTRARLSHVNVCNALWGVVFASLVIAVALVCASPSKSFADVRKADVICGQTVEERDLSVADCPSIEAERAFVMSSDGTVYFSRNSEDAAQIASITKVMTAIVAIENAPLNLEVPVSEAAASVGESSAGLQEGDIMDLESALKALLVPSGNDAAIAISEAVGALMLEEGTFDGDTPMQAFVNAMNAKADELGCIDTYYENPHGLDDDGWEGDLHSTAADQGLVARHAMSIELIRQIVGGGDTTISVMREGKKALVDLETTDLLLDMYSFTLGIKTGVTNLAGPSFMGAAAKDGIELYSVVLYSTSEYDRFLDTRTLFEWAFDHIWVVKLANASETTNMTRNEQLTQVPVIAKVSHRDWLNKTVKVTLADPNASVKVFNLEGNVTQDFEFNELHGTVRAGDKVGKARFYQRGRLIAEQDLIAAETVAAPDLFEGISIWWTRFVGGFNGEPEYAESEVYNVMPIINNKVSLAA